MKDHSTLVFDLLPPELRHPAVARALVHSLAEDLSPQAEFPIGEEAIEIGDVTSVATLEADCSLAGRILAKSPGVVAGLPVVEAVFKLVSPVIEVLLLAREGEQVTSGQVLAEVSGPGRALLAGERTALNFLGRLSGIATLTARFVEVVAGTQAVILDTRKTAPGLRHLDKYAVRQGGGQNHRMGLYDMALVKDNHIDGAGGLRVAVERVKARLGHAFPVEVEVKDLAELKVALKLNVDRILLDNMDLETMRRAVRLVNGQVALEASGNVTLENVREIAETGVDFISVGALTHSAPVFDVSMRLKS